VARYFDAFGRENVHVVIFDDLRWNAATVYAATLEFLNISPVTGVQLRPQNIARSSAAR
jgi:hypothetical protein